MQSLKNLKGNIIGKLTVISGPIVKEKRTFYECKCVCGRKLIVNAWYLKHKSNSCLPCSRIKHGHSAYGHTSKTYTTWDSMIQRCTNKKSKFYYCYGKRGIKVCKEWHDFKNFLNDMGEKPEGTSLDRIDVNKGYYKENCRWADIYTQRNNTRRNVFYEFDGKSMTLSEAARFYNVSRSRLNHYMYVKKLSFNECREFIFSKKNLRKKENQLIL